MCCMKATGGAPQEIGSPVSSVLRRLGLGSSALFLAIFLMASAVALVLTYFAVSGAGPIDRSSDLVFWLLGFNGVLIVCLAILVLRRYATLYRSAAGAGGGKLARRFVTVSSLTAVIPAAVVALFLGLSVARGLDYWFSERVSATVEETAEIARDNLENLINGLETDIRLLALDLNVDEIRTALTEEPEPYRDYLRDQAILRNLDSIFVINRDSEILSAFAPQASDVPPPVSEDFALADQGGLATRLFEQGSDAGQVRALYRLQAYDDAYVYVTMDRFAPATLARLRRAEAAVVDYRETLERSGRIGFVFAVGYSQIAALVFLISVRLGLEAAARVTQPLGRLAAAAEEVRDGRLETRVPVPEGDDEIATLSQSFNDMVQQISSQQQELESARQEAVDGRAFLQALLEDVNAGVIRTDVGLGITIANPAAHRLLGVETSLTGQNLADLVPEFAERARRSLKNQSSEDVSLDLLRDGVMRSFRVKTSPDQTGGCVLTFDDTTRLVSAQRQLAWRDVARRIAHEIRNPLTPIQLSTERLRRRYRDIIPADDATFDKCTDTILRQVGDIGRMVEEFSSFARMPKPVVESFDLVPLISRLVYAQRMVSPEVVVKLDAPAGAVSVEGDERLLGQAFSNLLKNAAEALSRRPETDDFDGQLQVTISIEGDDVFVAIEDNGPGFPGEDRRRLLEPYVTQREGGTGLGLAIVSRIVTDHGGEIALMNRKDARRGARVQVTLPHHYAGRTTSPLQSQTVTEESV